MTSTSENPLGSLLGSLLGGSKGGSQSGGNLLGSLMSNLGGSRGGQQSTGQQGGNPLGALMGLFEGGQAGQGVREKAQSWVATDQQNQPITPDEVSRAVPSEALHKAAEEHGMTDSQAADELARAIPEAVDKLTPNGAGDLSRSLHDVAGEVGGTAAGPQQKAA